MDKFPNISHEMLAALRALANMEYLVAASARLGIKFEPDFSIQKDLLNLLSGLLLPRHYLAEVKGRIERIETTSYPIGPNEYYPKGSFYHLSIIYSGQIPKEKVEPDEHGKEDVHGKQYGRFFFRNSTVHYDQDMKLIKVQHHHNQSSYKWHEISARLEEIFRHPADSAQVSIDTDHLVTIDISINGHEPPLLQDNPI